MSQNNPEDAATVEMREQPERDAASAEASRLLAERQRQRPFTFKDMQLAVGDRLQVQFPAHLHVPRTYVRLLGHLDKASLIVSAPVHKGRRVPLVDNELLVVRAFTRQSAFLFNTSVLRICRLPFDYLHLSFPTEIKGTVIRKATRVRASFPVEVVGGSAPAGDGPVIENISASGALVVAQAALGNKGDVLRLRFVLNVHDCETPIELDARLQYLDLSAEIPENGEASYQHGFEFVEPEAATLMMIKGFVYQQIIERPHALV